MQVDLLPLVSVVGCLLGKMMRVLVCTPSSVGMLMFVRYNTHTLFVHRCERTCMCLQTFIPAADEDTEEVGAVRQCSLSCSVADREKAERRHRAVLRERSNDGCPGRCDQLSIAAAKLHMKPL